MLEDKNLNLEHRLTWSPIQEFTKLIQIGTQLGHVTNY